MVVGGLSMLFMDEQLDKKLSSSSSSSATVRAAETPEEQAPVEQAEKTKAKITRIHEDECVFKMPPQYPTYTKKDYEKMTEWQIDLILKDYGLSVDGDLDYKKDFAINSFVWDLPCSHLQDSTSHQPKEKAAILDRIVESIRYVLGFV